MLYIKSFFFLSLCVIFACKTNAENSTKLQFQPVFTKHFKQESLSRVDISPDGSVVLAGSQVEKIRLWKTQQPNNIIKMDFESELVALNFTSLNNQVFFANKTGLTRMYDAELKETLFDYRFPVTSRYAAVSDNLDYVVYGERIFNRTQNQLLESSVGHAAQSSLQLNPQNAIITAGFHDERVVVRDSTGNIQAEWRLDYPVQTAAISGDGKTVVAATQNGNCYIWLLPVKQAKHRCDHSQVVITAYFNKTNTSIILVREKSISAYTLSPFTKIFDESTKQEIHASSLADNDWLAIGLLSGHIQIWDTTSGTLVVSQQASKARINAIDINTKANLLLTGSDDGDVSLYKLENKQ